jgi:hypothetical protein
VDVAIDRRRGGTRVGYDAEHSWSCTPERRLRECERQLRKLPELAKEPMKVHINPGVASAKLQRVGLMQDANGQLTFTLMLPELRPPDPVEHKPDA